MPALSEWTIQWSQAFSRWECKSCQGVSLSRDHDTMTHVTATDAQIDSLREKYSTAHGEAKDRYTKPNVLYHREGCKFLAGSAGRSEPV